MKINFRALCKVYKKAEMPLLFMCGFIMVAAYLGAINPVPAAILAVVIGLLYGLSVFASLLKFIWNL